MLNANVHVTQMLHSTAWIRFMLKIDQYTDQQGKYLLIFAQYSDQFYISSQFVMQKQRNPSQSKAHTYI